MSDLADTCLAILRGGPGAFRGSEGLRPNATVTESVAALIGPIVGKVDLDGVAASLEMSRRRLQEKLSAEGSSFRQISATVRIEHSKRLLLANKDPISQIALVAGYSDQAHFTRAFKELTGSTPSEFRRRSSDRPHTQWNR